MWTAEDLRPFQEWLVQGVGLLIKNLGVQDKSNRYWSGIIAPLYPNAFDLEYRVEFYTTCFREEYFDVLDSLEPGDLVFFQAVLTPATENSTYDGKIRGRARMRIHHCVRFAIDKAGDTGDEETEADFDL